MTVYRFRVKFEHDPRSLWRDIVIGEDRTLVEFQREINASVGLDQDHLWFFGTDQEYMDSDVKYRCPREADSKEMFSGWRDEETYNAGETTIADIVGQLRLEECDRICYLFDYGDEWRFYGLLKEIIDDAPGDRKPEVVEEKGDPVEQYRYP